jgi:hypothetical protein
VACGQLSVSQPAAWKVGQQRYLNYTFCQSHCVFFRQEKLESTLVQNQSMFILKKTETHRITKILKVKTNGSQSYCCDMKSYTEPKQLAGEQKPSIILQVALYVSYANS